MVKQLIVLLALAATAIFVQASSAAPPGATHVYGSGSSQWGGGSQAGTQSFTLNVFTTRTGELAGHMSWRGVSPASYPFPLHFSGHPSCLAFSPDGQFVVVSVVRYIPAQQAYVGPVEIIQTGSPQYAMSELLEASDLASAQSYCASIASTEDFPPLAPLDGHVTIVN
jgi:hypothetical protein